MELRVVHASNAELAPGEASEIVFVASGSGTLRVGGEVHQLEQEAGAFVGPGEVAMLVAATGELELVIVRTPAAELRTERVVRYHDVEAARAGADREFRLLIETSEATQFVGLIAPGRSRMHSHPYDEVAWLVEGDGVLHWHEGESVPVRRGSRIVFPRLALHALENTSGTTMRIMGVFSPAGSPADQVEVLDY